MSHDKWNEQAELYALGALEASENVEFEAHLKGRCRACEDALRRTRDSLTFLASSVPPAVPSASVKIAVMERIALEAPARPHGLGLRRGLAIGLAVTALVYAGFVVSLNREIEAEVRQLGADIEATAELARRTGQIMYFLQDPDVKLVRLEGVLLGQPVKGTLLWNSKVCRGLFLASGLAQAPQGKAYEFWVIEKGKPLAAGTFYTDRSGQCLFRLPQLPFGDFDQFAITLETAEGVLQPTGPILMSGTLLPATPA